MGLAAALNLRHAATHRARTLLALAGVAAGVAMGVAVGGLTTSIDAAVRASSMAAASGADLEIRPLTGSALPSSALDAVRATPGVRAAAATIEVRTQVRRLGATRSRPVYLIGFEPGLLALNPGSLGPSALAGADPTGLLITSRLSSQLGAPAGSGIQVYTPSGWQASHVGGVLRPAAGASPAIAGTGLLVASSLLGRRDGLDAIYVSAPGRAGEVHARLAERLGPSVRIGAAGLRTAEVRQITASVNVVLDVAAIVSLFAGGFLVYNTMSMAAVERSGEAAILRAVGATRRQTLMIMASEGAVLGMAGSILGLAAGVGLAKILLALRGEGLSLILPVEVTRLVLTPGRLLAAAGGGVGVSVLAAIGPARRVARTPPAQNLGPVAALEEPAAPPPWRQGAAGAAILAGGGIATAAWVRSSTLDLGLALGGMLAFMAGVAILVRPLVPILARIILSPVARRAPGRGPLRLAAGEVLRSPGRTSFTVGALVLSLSLVIGLQLDLSAFDQAFRQGLSRLIQADLLVRSIDWQPYGAAVGIDPALAAQVRSIPGVDTAYPSRTVLTFYRGRLCPVLAVSEEGYRRYGTLPRLPAPDRALNAAMAGGGKALVSASAARQFHLGAGGEVSFPTPSGTRMFKVVGTYEDPSAVLPTFYVTFEDARSAWGIASADVLDVFLKPGVPAGPVAAQIQARLGARYGIKAGTRRQFLQALNAILTSINKLLGSVQLVAVAVAILGIANTLLMSTVERNRELGVLRAVGMLRKDLFGMVLGEAGLLVLLGVGLSCFVGTGIGLFAHRITQLQTGLPIPLSFPPSLYGGVALLGLAAALVGAAYPGARAARLEVVAALQYE